MSQISITLEGDSFVLASDGTTIKGDKGDQGDPGPKGDQGNTGPTGPAGTMPGAGYAKYLAAVLDPFTLEPVQRNLFSYSVGANETKLLLASWSTSLGSGRLDVRNPRRFFPLRNVTLSGLATGATAIICDPSRVTYSDPWSVYYSRLQTLCELPTKFVALTAASQKKPLLPGAYGAILTQYTCQDFAWLVGRPSGNSGLGYNFWDEISDSAGQRLGDSLALPLSKWTASEVHSSSFAGSGAIGSVSFILLPSDWSTIVDPNTYTFRDDFMGASLDTGVWTRVQSSSGKVEIDTTYQWLKLFGTSVWGQNGLFRTSLESRSAGKALIVDYYVPQDAASGAGIVGWSDGAGQNYSNFAHGVNFGSGGVISVYENGNYRGGVGSGYTQGAIYRVRITLTSGGATYEIQGGTEYAPINGSTWTNITPSVSASSTNSLAPGASAYAGSSYISDFRVM